MARIIVAIEQYRVFKDVPLCEVEGAGQGKLTPPSMHMQARPNQNHF